MGSDIVKRLRKFGGAGAYVDSNCRAWNIPHCLIHDEAASLIERLEAENARLRSELEGAYERAARIADTGMLMPPDGGSPTVGECEVAEGIAAAIRSLKEKQG